MPYGLPCELCAGTLLALGRALCRCFVLAYRAFAHLKVSVVVGEFVQRYHRSGNRVLLTDIRENAIGDLFFDGSSFSANQLYWRLGLRTTVSQFITEDFSATAKELTPLGSICGLVFFGGW